MPEPQKLAYTIAEAVAVSGISRSVLFDLIAKGELPKVKIRTSTYIRHEDLKDLIDRHVVH